MDLYLLGSPLLCLSVIVSAENMVGRISVSPRVFTYARDHSLADVTELSA